MNDMQEIKTLLQGMNGRFDQMDKRLDQMDKRFDQMDKRLEQMDKRFDQMDKRLEQMDKRFEQVDKRLNKHEELLEQLIHMNAKTIQIAEETRAEQQLMKTQIDTRFNRIETHLKLTDIDNEHLSHKIANNEREINRLKAQVTL